MDYEAFDFIWQGIAGLGTPGTASGRGEGQEVINIDLHSAPPADDVLAGLFLGPTSNLRASFMRVGQTILGGYNDNVYTEMFG